MFSVANVGMSGQRSIAAQTMKFLETLAWVEVLCIR